MRLPADWRELQAAVARILAQCGFAAEVEKQVQLVRGSASIDVYAQEVRDNRTLTVFCECKYWQANVPQSAVHSFRSIVGDGGADVGYLVASSDFQPGAVSAAASTNVRLVTWPQFQSEFESTWVRNYLRPMVAEKLDALLTYTEPINSGAFRKFERLSESGKQRFVALRRHYTPFGEAMMAFTPYVAMFNDKLPALPVRLPADFEVDASQFPEGFFEAVGYADLLEIALPFGERAIEEFSSVLQPDDDPDWDPAKARRS